MHHVSTKSIRTLAGAIALACSAGMAQASTVVFETTGFFAGSDPGFANPSFTITASGDYLATLSDLSFAPLEFSTLLMSVSTSTTSLGSTSSPGSFSFTASPGNYFANVVGVPTSLGGLFGLNISKIAEIPVLANVSKISAIPVPAAVYLFFSGLMGLLFVGRTRKAG